MADTQGPSRQEIWKMFDQISPTYDRVNRVMTFGLDQLWRKRMARLLPPREGLALLDCATGTGDQILALLQQKSPALHHVVGIDLAQEMLTIAKQKILSPRVHFQVASALDLPFGEIFDCVTISFGIRNVTDVATALKEFYRVLKPQGRLLILEGSLPRNEVLRRLHLFYLRYLMPRIGGWISKNKEAYRYLNETIATFPSGEAFCSLMRNAGFSAVQAHPLMGGIVSIYQGDRFKHG